MHLYDKVPCLRIQINKQIVFIVLFVSCLVSCFYYSFTQEFVAPILSKRHYNDEVSVTHELISGDRLKTWNWRAAQGPPAQVKPIKLKELTVDKPVVDWGADKTSETDRLNRVYADIRTQAQKIERGKLGDFLQQCRFGASDKQKYASVFSAIRRAHSDQCKAELAVVACRIKHHKLYSSGLKQMRNYCTYDHRKQLQIGKGRTTEDAMDASEEGSVRILFFLQVSGRHARQIERLLRMVYSPRHFYLIHVDKASDYLYEHVTRLLDRVKVSNVRLMSQRWDTVWSSPHFMWMLMSAFKEAATQWTTFDFFINLSESHLPIRTMSELEDELEKNRGISFVAGQMVLGKPDKSVMNHTFYQCDGHVFRVALRQIPKRLKTWAGSDWFVLARNFVNYLLDPPPGDELVDHLLRFFSFSFNPSESFFLTTLKHSQLCETHVNRNMHYINWVAKVGCSCIEKRKTVDWCGCSPLVIRNLSLISAFQTYDLVNATKSNLTTENRKHPMYYFARKFDPSIALSPINAVESRLRKSDRKESNVLDKSWNSYWLSFFHVDFDASSEATVSESMKCIERTLIGPKLTSLIKTKHTFQTMEVHHFFQADQYIGDVFTLSVGKSKKSEKVSLQAFVYRRPKTKPTDFYDSELFADYATVTSNFDIKENVSRSYNNWLSPLDLSITMYAPLSETFTSRLTNQTDIFTSVYCGGKHLELSPKISSNDKVLRGKFQVNLTKGQNIPNGELVCEVFDEFGKLSLRTGHAVLGANTPINTVLKYYDIQEFCIVDSKGVYELQMLPSCIETDWSSFYPDPKSQFSPELSRNLH